MEKYPAQDGVSILSKISARFSGLYLHVREMEGRVYSDSELKTLPATGPGFRHHREWQMRKISANRFMGYLQTAGKNRILELGCGNGWFSAMIAAEYQKSEIIGADINMPELIQASRLFRYTNLRYANWDIIRNPIPAIEFDLIVLNSSIQYFKDIQILMKSLKNHLSDRGEIHILDSPIYRLNRLKKAKTGSSEYYNSLNTPNMTPYYFHHNWMDFTGFEKIYIPQNPLISKFLGKNQTPFPWIKWVKL